MDVERMKVLELATEMLFLWLFSSKINSEKEIEVFEILNSVLLYGS